MINHFARVRELAKKMLQENHYASNDLKTQKDFLDKGCRTFAMRMNRRRDIILTSLKFHKSAGDVRSLFCAKSLEKIFWYAAYRAVYLSDSSNAHTLVKNRRETS